VCDTTLERLPGSCTEAPRLGSSLLQAPSEGHWGLLRVQNLWRGGRWAMVGGAACGAGGPDCARCRLGSVQHYTREAVLLSCELQVPSLCCIQQLQ